MFDIMHLVSAAEQSVGRTHWQDAELRGAIDWLAQLLMRLRLELGLGRLPLCSCTPRSLVGVVLLHWQGIVLECVRFMERYEQAGKPTCTPGSGSMLWDMSWLQLGHGGR